MLQQLIAQLKTRNLMRVSLDTKISLATLQNIVAGRNSNPTWRTIDALQTYLKENENEPTGKSEKA